MRYTDKDLYSKNERLEVVLDNGEHSADWSSLVGPAITIASGSEHITGTRSVSFAKQAGGTKDVYIIRPLDIKNGYNLDAFSSEGLILSSVYIPSLTDVSSYNIVLLMSSGTENGVFYSVADTDLVVGWNNLKMDCNSYTSASGVGLDWNHVKYVAVGLTLDAADDTLAGILVDSIRVQVPSASFNFDTNVDNVTVTLDTDAANTARTTASQVLPVQNVDQVGAVAPAGNVNTNAPFAKITDGSDDLNLLAANASKSVSSIVVPVQTVDRTGATMPAGESLGNAPFFKLSDNVDSLDLIPASGTKSVSTVTVPVQCIGLDGVPMETVSNSLSGASIYSAGQGDFTVAYTSSATVTLAGLPFTPTSVQFIEVVRLDTTGKQTKLRPYNYAFSYVGATGVLTVTGVSFVATDTYDVFLWGPQKTVNTSANAQNVLILNPGPSTYTSATLLTGTAATGDVYSYIDVAGLRYAGLQYSFTAGTCSGACDVSLTDDGSAASSCVYVPYTYDRFGVHYVTASSLLEFDTPLVAKYLRVKVSATSGTYQVFFCGIY